MKLIAHRCNTPLIFDDPSIHAIEFDVRDSDGQLIVTHDPYTIGSRLEHFLRSANGKFLIVNIKSAGIERDVLNSLESCAPDSDFFFLDCTVPAMVGLADQGEKRFAIRYSEFEPLESVLVWEGKAKWVWVDCFTTFILTKEKLDLLHDHGFNVCLVSPELQGRPQDIDGYVQELIEYGIKPDAVCTKAFNFYRWVPLQNL